MNWERANRLERAGLHINGHRQPRQERMKVDVVGVAVKLAKEETLDELWSMFRRAKADGDGLWKARIYKAILLKQGKTTAKQLRIEQSNYDSIRETP